MFGNYFKGQFRVFRRNKALSLINLVSLSVGMACCLVIAAWVHDELSYDRFHANGGQLFRVWEEWDDNGEIEKSAITSEMLGAALEEEIPEVLTTCRFLDRGKQFIRYEDQRYFDEELVIADPTFLEMFTFPLVRGDKQSALADPSSVVVSESMARKYFGDSDPLGEVLNINRRDYTVSAVMEDVPANSHLRFDCLASFDSRSDYLKELTASWSVSVYYTYVQLREGADLRRVSELATAIQTRNTPDSKHPSNLNLQPLTRIHLHHDIQDYLEGHGEILYVYLFSALAVLLLVVAGINYMNLTTARATERAREIGLRKAIGASRGNLIRQFYGEAAVNTFVAGLLAAVLVELFLPLLSQWSDKQLHFSPFTDLTMFLTLIGVLVITAAMAGSYPALILSAFAPARVLKGRMHASPSGVLFRRVLVVVQFATAIVLIAGTFTIQGQLSYIGDKALGFEKDNLMYLDMRGEFLEHYASIKEELLAQPSILNVTAGRSPVDRFNSAVDLIVEGRQMPEEIKLGRSAVDADYIETMGMEIVRGRSFLSESGEGIKSGFVLNETAMAALGPEVRLGSHMTFKGHNQDLEKVTFEGNVVGVVKDFHNRSVQTRIMPVIMYYSPEELYDLNVRIAPGKQREAIAAVGRLWQIHASQYPFQYHFVDETLNSFYLSQHRLREMFNAFTLLAIMISCLGLIGLASHAADRRIKEIGIRRVLGASAASIVKLMSLEIVMLVLLASVIAVPAAWYVAGHWLEQFVYRITPGWALFVFPVVLAMIMALATVGFQAIRAMRVNPVESLRYE